jgi:hypothetical protein
LDRIIPLRTGPVALESLTPKAVTSLARLPIAIPERRPRDFWQLIFPILGLISEESKGF